MPGGLFRDDDSSDDIASPAAVAVGLACLRALGAPGPAWEWEPIVEVDTSPAV